MDIGKGDWVEYIGDGQSALAPAPGSIWRCDGVISNNAPYDKMRCHRCGQTGTSLAISGLAGGIVGGWCATSFRPIRSDISSLERLLAQPIKVGG